MFSKLISRNSKQNRKENRLFFGSLIIPIIAFYMILALSRQDVMVFLKTLESDAIARLLSMIPVFYGMTLFLLFFLIYYASKYQLERRRHAAQEMIRPADRRRFSQQYRLPFHWAARGSSAVRIGQPDHGTARWHRYRRSSDFVFFSGSDRNRCRFSPDQILCFSDLKRKDQPQGDYFIIS